MKVDDRGSTGGVQGGGTGLGVPASALKKPGTVPGVGESTGSSGGAGAVGGSGDEVALSSLAGRISAEGPDAPEREAKIAQLAAVFESGSYEVDAEAVADAMMGEAESQGLEG